MKKTLFFIGCMLVLALPSIAQDELPKEEEKAWKNRLKSFYKQYKKDLAGFKDYVETNEANAAKVGQLESEVSRLNEKSRAQTSELDNLRTENSNLQDQVLELQSKVNDGGSNTGGGGGIPQQGLVFTVQIGAYTTINGVDGGSSNNFNSEVEGDVTKYMIGIFDNYQAAEMMRNNLRKMGVKDAWVVAYQDGQRVPVSDVAGQ